MDVRIIAATNRNLEEMIERKEFREDLYYRLNVVPLHLPPLRERAGDIPVLVQYFLGKYDKILEKDIRGVSTLVLEKLMEYCWPGNVRELENCVEYMMTFEKSGNIVTDAFGVVAMVAMTPLITIQVMGLASRIRAKRGAPEGMSAAHGQSGAYAAFELLDDDAIIEL